VIGLLVLAFYVVGRQHSPRLATTSTSTRHALYWVDPMHQDCKSDHPGVAPGCAMALEPVYAEPVSSTVTPAAPLSPGSVGIGLEKQQLFGIRLATVDKTAGAEKLRVLGRPGRYPDL
jgi:hypothetical protein